MTEREIYESRKNKRKLNDILVSQLIERQKSYGEQIKNTKDNVVMNMVTDTPPDKRESLVSSVDLQKSSGRKKVRRDRKRIHRETAKVIRSTDSPR